MTSNCQSGGSASTGSILFAFQALETMFVRGRDPHQIADQIGMPPKDLVVFFGCFFYFSRGLGQTLYIRSEQLQTLGQGFVSFGKTIQAFVGGHGVILLLTGDSLTWGLGKA